VDVGEGNEGLEVTLIPASFVLAGDLGNEEV
jgi:hypothetical protein